MGRQVPALERGLQILELLADRTPELFGSLRLQHLNGVTTPIANN